MNKIKYRAFNTFLFETCGLSLGVPVFRGLWTVYFDDFDHNFLDKCVMEDAKQGVPPFFLAMFQRRSLIP